MGMYSWVKKRLPEVFKLGGELDMNGFFEKPPEAEKPARPTMPSGSLQFDLSQLRVAGYERNAKPSEVTQEFADGFNRALSMVKNMDPTGDIAMGLIFTKRLFTIKEAPVAKFFDGEGKEVDLETYLAKQAKIDRFCTHYTDMAARHGWKKDDGEGPVEFLMRQAYTTGHSDAIHRESRIRVSRPLLAEAAQAIEQLSDLQPDNDCGDYWAKHYSELAKAFRKMLAKANSSES